MSFTSNDTLKKLEKLLPESINNQLVPKDVLVIIDEYIPQPLTDKNIRNAIIDYFSNNDNLKQQVIEKYGQISNWNVSNVTSMKYMFSNRESFNQPLNNWDVSNVTDMSCMFLTTKSFNQPLNNWDVSNVTTMRGMFRKAKSFNHPLDNWNVSKVTNMEYMFSSAKSFNQHLDTWNVSNVTDVLSMFSSCNYSLDHINTSIPSSDDIRDALLNDIEDSDSDSNISTDIIDEVEFAISIMDRL